MENLAHIYERRVTHLHGVKVSIYLISDIVGIPMSLGKNQFNTMKL